jgi:hypothetical protein
MMFDPNAFVVLLVLLGVGFYFWKKKEKKRKAERAAREAAAVQPSRPVGEVKPPIEGFHSVSAFMTWALSQSHAVTLDGETVREGFGPAVHYEIKADGSVTRI